MPSNFVRLWRERRADLLAQAREAGRKGNAVVAQRAAERKAQRAQATQAARQQARAAREEREHQERVDLIERMNAKAKAKPAKPSPHADAVRAYLRENPRSTRHDLEVALGVKQQRIAEALRSIDAVIVGCRQRAPEYALRDSDDNEDEQHSQTRDAKHDFNGLLTVWHWG